MEFRTTLPTVRAKALLLKSDNGGESSWELILRATKKKQAEAFAAGFQNATSLQQNDTTPSSGNPELDSNEENARAFLDAKNAYIRQEFIFSTIDRVAPP